MRFPGAVTGADVTLGRIEAAAPDQASLNAARKLLKEQSWPDLEHDAAGALLWGTCQGSGATPYRVAVATADLGAKCSCPSRKFPCKHAIALMWWRAERPERFTQGEVPQWVSEWLGRRRGGAGSAANDAVPEQGGAKSAAAASNASDSSTPKDSQAGQRQRERSRQAREQSIRDGLDELDTWLSDQVDRGLGRFASDALARCRLLSQRLVDAKAGGAAARIEALQARYFAAPESQRPDLLIQTFGSLHLLGEAYRRQEQLSPELRADVRRLVGWTESREEVLRDANGVRATGNWVVVATARETQVDRLVRYDTWLIRDESTRGYDHAAPGAALLTDYVPASATASSAPALEPGTRIEAELVFYPSTTPLRALIAKQMSTQPAAGVPDPCRSLEVALNDYDARVVSNPWLPPWPVGSNDISVRRDDSGALWAVDEGAGQGVPLADQTAAPLQGLQGITLYGAYDGHALTPLAANTTLGPWWTSAA